MKRLFAIGLSFLMLVGFSADAIAMSDGDKSAYLEWIKKLGAFNGALAIAPNGCWRARHASDLYRVKKEVLKVCKSECKSNNCEVVDVNGTSTFINKGKGSSSSSSVRTSTNYSPYFYNFFGALSPVRGTKTNTIKPDFIWNCSLEQTMGMVAGPPYQKEVQEFDESLPESIKSSYTMSTYENNTGIKWRLTFHDQEIGFEVVVDVGVRGDKFRNIKLNYDHSDQDTTPGNTFKIWFRALYAPYIGQEFKQDLVFPSNKINLVRMLRDGFGTGVDTSTIMTGDNASLKYVVLGETTIDHSRFLVLGTDLKFNVSNVDISGVNTDLAGSVKGFQLIDLVSGLPTNRIDRMKVTFKVKAKQFEGKLEIVEKRLCKKEVMSSTTSSSNSDAALELEYWNVVKNSKNVDLLQAYLDEYPNGIFTPLVKIKIKILNSSSGDN